jgi:hypothetical protein
MEYKNFFKSDILIFFSILLHFLFFQLFLINFLFSLSSL